MKIGLLWEGFLYGVIGTLGTKYMGIDTFPLLVWQFWAIVFGFIIIGSFIAFPSRKSQL